MKNKPKNNTKPTNCTPTRNNKPTPDKESQTSLTTRKHGALEEDTSGQRKMNKEAEQ
ncbi:hypothetical protein L2735_14485 [Shewanella olleyana]|uniref:hypothetical protein n=1 Tax=Shewanella olleyana TaxID=135626 RepID=UPI00200CA025|nr:hypothetical protein [Shewanella olleyana]MCL1067999.1 hypothetical protein [Shewanella olleyana]